MKRAADFSTYTGRLDISKPMGGDPSKAEVHIRLSDEASGIFVMEIRLPLLVFAEALFSKGHNLCKYEINDKTLALIGMVKERKVERIEAARHPSTDKEKAVVRALVKQLEVDGWSADYGNLENHHLTSMEYPKKGEPIWIAKVSFERWVNPKTKEPVILR